MRPTIALIFIGFLVPNCGQPPRQDRTGGRGNYSLYNDEPYQYRDDEDSSHPGNHGESVVSEDIKHCKWAINGSLELESSHRHLSPNEAQATEGAFTFCQSTNNKANIYVQLKHPITEHKLCFFPVNTTTNITKKLGRAVCRRIPKADSIYPVVLSQTRHRNLPINGILVARDKEYLHPTSGQTVVPPIYYEKCDQYGQNSSYCRIFKELGQYVLHQFKSI